ncbi:unnamed protein product, partial [Meganyctiphanes norvegica]
MEEHDTETSDQSEFNSDAEDVEFGLYASLYFDPNPDFLPVQNIKAIDNENKHKNICTPETQQPRSALDSSIRSESVSNVPLDIDRETGVIITTKVGNELNQNVQKEDKNPDKNKVENNQKQYIGDGESSRRDLNNEVNKKDCHNINIKNHSMEKTKKRQLESDNKLKAQMQNKHVASDDTDYEKRVRQSSICSVDSIAGNTKLDSLYTMNFSSSDEDDYQQELDSKLAINNIISKKNKEKGITSQNKRKRDMEKLDEIQSDDEDSKCHVMSKATKKKKLEGDTKKVDEEIDSSESDSDIYVCPPSPKQIETLDLSSETESISQKEIVIENLEGNDSEAIGNYGLGSMKSSTQSLKSKKLTSQSSEISKKGMLLSIDDYSSKVKSKKNKKSKEKKSSKDCIIISEDSDDSLDIAEISKGTALVMNLGGGLNSFIERPDTKKAKEKKSKKTDKGKPSSSFTEDKYSTVDYTLNRQLTTKIPSCNKWTPEMATFYDSDISEDLEVEDIHAQQSDSPLLWNIIPSDYPVRGRRRYFNQEVRCKRCRQFGHEEKYCPRVPRCHLCSGTDHIVRYQCPDNCCFRCGGEPHAFCQKTLNTTICKLCGWPGHVTNLCPDLWRRFHITTSGIDPLAPVLLNSTLRPRSEAYCYCCARRGHFGHECPDRQQLRSCVPVGQSVVSYAPPVLQREGERAINLDGCEGPLDEEAYNPVTKIKIKMKDGGRIVGKSGVVVKDIERRTGAKVNIVTKNGKQMVCVYGNAEAREAAKKLIEVILEKIPPNGFENFVIHIARINNDPNILNILKKSKALLGNKFPNKISQNINDFSPNVVSSKREDNKEELYHKNEVQISQERLLFNETPRKRLREDESLKEDFLSLNTKSGPIMIRGDQISQSSKESSKSDHLLSTGDSLQKDFRSLITLKKSLKQSHQLSQDDSLQEDFLSLKTPKRIQFRNDDDDDDIEFFESLPDIRNKTWNQKIDARRKKMEYTIDFAEEPNNRETKLESITRLALEEELDNLGIQVTFMKGLRQNLPRNKGLLLQQCKDLLARIDSMDYDIPSIVNKIRKNRIMLTQSDPVFQQKKWLKKNLQMVSMVVVGQERLGSGANLRWKLKCLLKEVKASKGKATQQCVSEITETFKQICDPSVKEIDEILSLAKTYMQKYPQGNFSTPAYVTNTKKGYKKQKPGVVNELKKKKKFNDQGKLQIIKSPKSFKKKNKAISNESVGMSSKCLDLNRKPKKNKKKKLKIRTRDGKRNWNAVFNNSH